MSGRLRIAVHFGERDLAGGRFLAQAVIDAFDATGVRSSILLRGASGFGLTHHLRTDRRLTLSEDLPIVAMAVDEGERIRAASEAINGLMESGLVTISEVAGAASGSPVPGREARLTILLGRRHRAAGNPAFMAVCELLRERGIAGATALLGVDGTLRGVRRRAGFLERNADVPVLVIAVGAEHEIAATIDELRDVLGEEALLSVEPLRVVKRDGERLGGAGDPPPAGAGSAGGMERMTLYVSESSLHEGRPVYAEMIARLRVQGARGATAVRGIWGFHGDHAPHGDRILQLRRRVPIVLTVVDAAERMPGWLAIADELTARTGLITVEPLAQLSDGGAANGGR